MKNNDFKSKLQRLNSECEEIGNNGNLGNSRDYNRNNIIISPKRNQTTQFSYVNTISNSNTFNKKSTGLSMGNSISINNSNTFTNKNNNNLNKLNTMMEIQGILTKKKDSINYIY